MFSCYMKNDLLFTHTFTHKHIIWCLRSSKASLGYGLLFGTILCWSGLQVWWWWRCIKHAYRSTRTCEHNAKDLYICVRNPYTRNSLELTHMHTSSDERKRSWCAGLSICNSAFGFFYHLCSLGITRSTCVGVFMRVCVCVCSCVCFCVLQKLLYIHISHTNNMVINFLRHTQDTYTMHVLL